RCSPAGSPSGHPRGVGAPLRRPRAGARCAAPPPPGALLRAWAPCVCRAGETAAARASSPDRAAGATGPTGSRGARGRPWSACHARRRRQRDGDGGFRESCLTPVIMSLSHTLYCRSLGEVGMRLLVSALLLGLCPAALDAQEVDWSANGRDAQGTRYSPASQITRKNVSGLEVAW